MNKDKRVYDKVRIVYELPLPMPVELQSAMAWATIMTEQISIGLTSQPQTGSKLISVEPILKEGIEIPENAIN